MWNIVQRCFRYVSTFTGAHPIGFNWLEVDFLTRTYGIEMSPLLLEKLRVIEKLVVEAALEKGDK